MAKALVSFRAPDHARLTLWIEEEEAEQLRSRCGCTDCIEVRQRMIDKMRDLRNARTEGRA